MLSTTITFTAACSGSPRGCHREYSGSFNVRIDRRVHRALAIEAAQAGVSLNALVAQCLVRQSPAGIKKC
ncbi:MAG: toxin-antitoxin system HicB family antitoxin [Candidimonas sp.]|nr:MAG: toxin-antitoxin system HicB family antitoxin [Candidimonas sp.]TAM80831.1 MAG: toxin-antitoxin system HicB family antitoxin [Candidimonas sp.]